ncbi:ARM repeat-containing protein [Tuber magnatum]|uniref:ARM repeat-containing protein n=1 Tax=Tuber magnatum TaxID=42249 RepID=A0A317T2B2_9PEZI|nr:ARM repeat-containing protein [Tuber magnatum]
MDEHSFVQLLEHVLTPDTNIVKHATGTLRRDYYSKPESLPALLHLLRTHPNPQIRQLAAVEARSLVPKFWVARGDGPSQIPAELKLQLRESILQSTIEEANSLVKHSSARVISSMAKIDLPVGEWTDLPGFLVRAASSDRAENREVGVYILFTLIESLEEVVADKWHEFLPLFSQTINDQGSMAVRLNTLLALGKMAESLNSEKHPDGVAAFKEVLPSMVAVLKELIDAADEEKANSAFEVFQTLLIVDSTLISSHFRDLVQFFSDLASSTNVDDDFRSKAMAFLMSCLRYKKMKMQSLKLGEQLTLRALQIVTEFRDLEDSDETSPARSALGLLDYLSASLPPSQVVVPLLNVLPQYTGSRDPEYRKAAVLALGMCVEGAPDFIATQISSIFPVVLQLLSDPEARVRQAALHTVAQLADDLAEDMGKEHSRLIPALIRLLDSRDGSDAWKAACNAIDAVLVGIDKKDVGAYLPTLMPRLSEMFQRDDLKLKAAAVGGIGSTAQAAKDGFSPYFQATMGALFPYISVKDSEDELDLRGVVVDAMGNIAEAVGMQAFTPYVQPLMQSTMDALNLGHSRLRETSFMFFSTMARVYREEFTPFLPNVTQALFQSLEQTETDIDVEIGELAKDAIITSVGAVGTRKVSLGEDIQAEIQPIDIDADDEDDALWDELNAVNAVALEKEVAAEVIGEVLSNCKEGYLQYLEKTVELLALKAQHPYEGVRKASISTLWRAYATLWQVMQNKGMTKWLPGLPLKVQPSPELVRLGNVVINCTLANWSIETDRQIYCNGYLRKYCRDAFSLWARLFGRCNRNNYSRACKSACSYLEEATSVSTRRGRRRAP